MDRRHGPETVWLRHELFFQQARPGPLGRYWRAAGGLFRDAAWLVRPVDSPASRRHRLGVLVTTLHGSSGWGALAHAVASVREAGLFPLILAHPRLERASLPTDIPVMFLGGLNPATAMGEALRRGLSPFAAARSRRALWNRAVERALGGRSGILIVHNDFDMMSVSCLESGWPSVCLQHGVPTDEFFPVRADYQVVWGESSVHAYLGKGVPGHRLVVDSLGRGARYGGPPTEPPLGLSLVSQGHAAIFGDALPELLHSFAEGLCREWPETTILLHPGEVGRHVYGGGLTPHLRRPPHAVLRPGHNPPALVLGYCSTAMIDAALAGHWVAAILGPLGGNEPALDVARPPLRVATPSEAAGLYHRLHDDSGFREDAARLTDDWIRQTFSPSPGGLCGLLRSLAG